MFTFAFIKVFAVVVVVVVGEKANFFFYLTKKESQIERLEKKNMNFFCFKTSRLKKRSEDLFRETSGCQRQFKKDRMLGLMNLIKFCELDEVT